MILRTQSASYLRYTSLGIILFLLFLVQTTPGLLPAIGGASPVLLLPFVVSAAMMEQEMAGAAFGLFAGLLMDMYAAAGSGFHAISLMIIGCICGLFVSRLLTVTFRSALILYIGSSVLYFGAQWLIFYVIPQYEAPITYLLRHQLPCALYSFIFLIPMYYFVRWIHRKMAGA